VLTTAQSLPFDVRLAPGALSDGGSCCIDIRSHQPNAVRLVESALHRFVALAQAGCLSGDSISPASSTIEAVAPQWRQDHQCVLDVTKSLVDERAVFCLVHLLIAVASESGIESVTISNASIAAGRGLTQLLSASDETPYPRRVLIPSFTIHDSKPEGGGFSLRVQFAEDIAAASQKVLNTQIASLCAAIANGAYVLDDLDISASYLEPHTSEVIAYSNVVEWAILKLVADQEAVLHALINLLDHHSLLMRRICHIDIY
jgi:hypothetical protein